MPTAAAGLVLALVALAIVGTATTTTTGASTPIAVSALFGDNMVLQCSKPTVITGRAAPAEAVSLTGLPTGMVKTTANSTGAFELFLPAYTPPTPGARYILQLAGASAPFSPIVAHNVSFGDVLLCSGQSNMALDLIPIYGNDSIIQAAHHPEIRLFKVPLTPEAAPVGNVTAQWVPTTPKTVVQFSAICYLTALELQRLRGTMGTGVFGLIEVAVGSTDIQSWMSAEMREAARTTCWAAPGHTPPAVLPPSQSNPKLHAPATTLWNGMVAPLRRFALRAMLWDQGENNSHYCSTRQYNCLFSVMIAFWRAAWGATPASLPFGFVQLGGYLDKGNVSTIRFAQAATLPPGPSPFCNASGVAPRLPSANTCMAPTFDLGSPQPGHPAGTWWIHCRNKTEVARRLGRQLHHLLLQHEPGASKDEPGAGAAGVEYSGPTVVRAALRHSPASVSPQVELSLAHADGLQLAPAQGCVRCCAQPLDGREADGHLFEVMNRAGHWLPATGAVSGPATVLVTPHANVSSDWVSGVRYSVQDIPQCPLYNSDALPAAPFQLPVPWPPAP